MVTRAWFLFSVLWFVMLATMLNWQDLDQQATRQCLFLALLPLLAGAAIKRGLRYVVRGE